MPTLTMCAARGDTAVVRDLTVTARVSRSRPGEVGGYACVTTSHAVRRRDVAWIAADDAALRIHHAVDR
ncbi:hypothetical protein [Candidatus Frankia nodulisporulans]|uniref:hypothetical protein n=1 Tax=Candidatus Frankia nodulisporulans TaxID=2060052 RepID=UPI0015831891|nr:hypothetical protein [Candidatus Frankia nodulisporulans]